MFARNDKVIEIFLRPGLSKWKDTLYNYEEDNSYGENVSLFTVVSLSLFYFGSHICHCTSVGLKCIEIFVGCKPEVSNFDVHLVVQKDILKLEISVRNSLFLHVNNNIEQLCQEKPSSIFTHATDVLT